MSVKRICCCLYWLFIFSSLAAQDKYTISGTITNAKTGAPISNASVYIANTSHGTATDKLGVFELHHVAPGNFQLIVSYVGYVTRIFPFSSDSLPMKLNATLDLKPTELDSVMVKPFMKDGWEKWGQFFVFTFIGTSVVAREAIIVNNKAIKFRWSTKPNVLEAVADEPLIIENKALGYRIKYDLEEYSYDSSEHILYFEGFRFFEDMAKDMTKIPRRWIGNRRQAYQGSIMHFMRALYHNKLKEEGFEVTRLTKQGVDYFAKTEKLLTADSLLSNGEDSTKQLLFKDHLSVTYLNAKADQEYTNPESGKKGGWRQHSIINLRSSDPVSIEYNGNYFPPLNILLREYWGWSEKVGRTLPLDYVDESESDKK